ncbi:Transcription initiation factor TFIID subunit 12 [Wickerhamomyces ciferrii]|uniref:TBP-associated factor 12 n=1 Tax=Wickerhamomyces ciferrii (strain ATCC 14091 / BCRC 22168 / CBS 111 / JCM 3599 / NBRC 0793 / NRRL Y-1031 F-60-10) TaxID=1206466 RepID=K0KQE0_WICCF|nr:Transcription initiation factor TFIID subunit 12 [Wickerhamomyces ciferrii]CCH44367.1 Transcription initiation factor TFIID subunit 12 [Wickerhamomyces ciferrii]
MNQQPNQQQQQGQPQARPPVTFQPGQIQQLVKQCNIEFTEAKKLGLDTPAGQERLKKAQRIKHILVQYQSQQQRLSNSQGGTPQTQTTPTPRTQPQTQSQPQPLTEATINLYPQSSSQTSIQSPQLNQVQQQQLNQRSSSQQSPVPQQQAIPQQTAALNNNGQTASPSPMAQATSGNNPQPGGGGSGNGNTPNPQVPPKNPYQQLQQVKIVLGEFQKNLKAVDDKKKSGNLTPEQMQNLLQQEQVLKTRFNTYKTAAINLSQQIQKQQLALKQQQQQQQQQNFQNQSRSQSAVDNSANQIQSPSIGQNAIQNQQQAQQGNNTNLQNNSPMIQQNQAQNLQNNGNNNNFQFNQQQSPQLNQQQNNTQAQAIQNQQRVLSQSQTPQTQQQQIPKPYTQQQQQQQPQIQAQATIGQTSLPQQGQPQIPVQNNPNVPLGLNQQQAQQARSNLQSRTGTPQPQVGANIGTGVGGVAAQGRSASPNTPVTNVNAAARPNSANGNIVNPAQAANVFKTAVPSMPIPNQINVKPPTAVAFNQNRPSLTGGQGISAPALTTPAIMKLPPYEMQSDRVLSKRKLSELVKTVGADEGDGETTIDGDVEELLLDLADEFVTNVTGFACRLAKHRKSENLDVKDVQLHLEKNWNIRIPGYSSDEIRSVRKWVPSNAHNQRIQGIGISKSVEQNK